MVGVTGFEPATPTSRTFISCEFLPDGQVTVALDVPVEAFEEMVSGWIAAARC
jgi:hypothetical protein